MRHSIFVSALALLLPLAAQAATRTYNTAEFDSVAVAAGVDAQITLGTTRSVVADSSNDDFDSLRVVVEGRQLKIDRPSAHWLSFRRPHYTVRVVTPELHSVSATSGSDVEVHGASSGDFSLKASSGSDMKVALTRNATVKVDISSGSDVDVSGECTAVQVEASSGSHAKARHLKCETAAVQASSGADVDVFATRIVTGHASSGANVNIAGAPTSITVEKSSGADINRE